MRKPLIIKQIEMKKDLAPMLLSAILPMMHRPLESLPSPSALALSSLASGMVAGNLLASRRVPTIHGEQGELATLPIRLSVIKHMVGFNFSLNVILSQPRTPTIKNDNACVIDIAPNAHVMATFHKGLNNDKVRGYDESRSCVEGEAFYGNN